MNYSVSHRRLQCAMKLQCSAEVVFAAVSDTILRCMTHYCTQWIALCNETILQCSTGFFSSQWHYPSHLLQDSLSPLWDYQAIVLARMMMMIPRTGFPMTTNNQHVPFCPKLIHTPIFSWLHQFCPQMYCFTPKCPHSHCNSSSFFTSTLIIDLHTF